MSAYERRRQAIEDARQEHVDVTLRARMQGLARGDFDDEAEALEGIDGPAPVTEDDVLMSFARDLDLSKQLRGRSPRLAAEYESNARTGMGCAPEGDEQHAAE